MAKKRGNSEGSIYKMSDGRWRAAVTIGKDVNGKPKRKVFTAATRGEVANQLTKALQDRQDGFNVAPEKITVGALLRRWLTDVVKPSRSWQTHESYKFRTEKHLAPGLGNILLTKLTTPEIQRFLNEKHQSGCSPKTVKDIRDTLRAALNVAMKDWELIKRNPASAARPPARTKSKIRVWDVAQAKQFLDAAAGHRWGALFSVAVCLGPRQGEVLGLQWPNLDLEKGKLTIDGALKRQDRKSAGRVRMVAGKPKPVRTEVVKGKTKKEASNRTIALPAVTVAALLRHRAQQEQDRQWAGSKWQEAGYVFTTRKGTPLDRASVRREFYKLVKVAEVPQIRFHDMRHSAATLLFAQGVHPKTVMEILGHSDLKTTMAIYGHVLDQMKVDAAAKMDEIFGVATTVATKPLQTPRVNQLTNLN